MLFGCLSCFSAIPAAAVSLVKNTLPTQRSVCLLFARSAFIPSSLPSFLNLLSFGVSIDLSTVTSRDLAVTIFPPSPFFHRKGPQTWSLKREMECFTALNGGGRLARVLYNCHFSQSLWEGTKRRRRRRVARKGVQIETFDICFVRTAARSFNRTGGAKRAVSLIGVALSLRYARALFPVARRRQKRAEQFLEYYHTSVCASRNESQFLFGGRFISVFFSPFCVRSRPRRAVTVHRISILQHIKTTNF